MYTIGEFIIFMLGLPCRYDASDNIIIKVLGNKYLKSRGAKSENHFAPTIAIKYSIPVNKKYFHKPSFFSLKYLFPLVLNKYITSNKSCLLYTSPSPRDRTRSR